MGKDKFAWPDNKECAVSFTYDDALPCHYEYVAPQFESIGGRATFYLSMAKAANNPEGWKKAAADGHELGNHSIWHPCRDEKGDSSWITPEYNLCDYTAKRWEDEITFANKVIAMVDGKNERTFGAPCHQLTFGRGRDEKSIKPIIEKHFTASRCTHTGSFNDPITVDLQLVDSAGIGKITDADFVIGKIEKARAAGGWMVFCLHGVGEGTHAHYAQIETHERIIEYLGKNRDTIWTTTVLDAAQHIIKNR